MILGLQIIAIVFSLVMIYFAVLHYKRMQIGKMELMSWSAIWSATIFVVMFPDLLRGLAKSFFITRLFDLMVVAGFVLVISMVAKSYVTTKKLEGKFEELIRKESMNNAKKHSKSKKK